MSLKARPSSGLSTTSYTSHLSSKTDLGLATEEDKPVFVLADYKPLPWPNRDSQSTLLEVKISSEIMNLEPAVAKPSEVQEFLAVDHDQSFKKSLHKPSRDGKADVVDGMIRGFSVRGNQYLKHKLDKKDKQDYAALHYAVRYGHADIVQLLIEAGADPNVIGDDGIQPIHLAARHTRQARPERASVSTTIANTDSKGALAKVPILQLLLRSKANCNAMDDYDQTPLHYAAIKGNKDAVEILLDEKGIDIEAKDKSKSTPLHAACGQRSKEIVSLLLLKGANLLANDDENLTPFHYAVFSGHTEIMQMINRKFAYLTPENLIELVVFIFAIVYVTDFGSGKMDYLNRLNWF